MFSLLIYDIPTEKSRSGECPNPSGALRRSALRINLSCWLVRNDAIPHHVIQSLTDGGARWHLAPFDDQAAGGLLQYGAEVMKRETNDQSRRVNALIERGPENSSQAAYEKWQRLVTLAVRRLENLIADHEAACQHFGIDGDVVDFRKARGFLGRLNQRAAYQARVYCATVEALPEGGMKEAARRDEVPAEILADYAQDHGAEQEGAELAETTR